MSVNGKYPEQLIAMVTPEMKADIRAEADARGVSISQIVREAREIAVWARQPQRWVLGPDQDGWVAGPECNPLALDHVNHPVGVAFADNVLLVPPADAPIAEHIRYTIDSAAMAGRTGGIPIQYTTGDPDTLAAYAADLSPDTEPDEVDGSLSDQSARVARLKARGLL